MANGEKRGVLERGANFFEKLHYGLGAAALAGAYVAPEFAPALIVFGVYELAHGGLINVIKNKFFKKNKAAKTSGKLALVGDRLSLGF